MNQFFLVGRLVNNFEKKEKDGKIYSTNTLRVGRQYKNADGIYESDFFDFTIFDNMANSCIEYCKKGDLVGLKGTLSKYDNKISLKVDKVSFLATKKKTDDLENTKELEI